MRNYDILILGIETKIGQHIFSLLEKDYPFLTVAVPLSNYSQSIRFPQNQVKINFSQDSSIKSIVSSFGFIIAFDKKKAYQKLISEAKESFLDVSTFSLEMVIDIFKQKANIKSKDSKYELRFNASITNFFRFLLYPRRDFMPKFEENAYKMKISDIESREVFLSIYLIFASGFFAYIFLILGIICKPFILLKKLFGIKPSISFNKKSKDSFTIVWQQTFNVALQYNIYPFENKDEKDVIYDYLCLNLIKILRFRSPYNHYECKSICYKIRPNVRKQRKTK